MKSIKKFIAVILVFAMSSGIMCFAADENIYNGFEYSGSAITGYTGSTSGLIIPDTINNVAITSIKADAFQNKSFITSVIIPASITKIGDGAFAGCSNLREVKFEGETAVIGKSVFSGCSQLSKITLPSGLTAIKNSTFYGCSSLTDIDIPDSVTKIEDSAFENSGLTQVSISADISGIGALAFAGCKDLKAFYVDANNSAYCTDSCNALFSKDMAELIQFPACSSVTEYTIPEGTTTIDELAFAKNKTLETVTFSSTVNEISPYAFSECTALANVYLNEGLRTIGALAFSGCTSLKSITIPSTVTDFGSAFYNSGLTSVVIENGVTTISSGAFDTCLSLESVSIPKSITTIEAGAFKDCTSLKNIDIPENTAIIGSAAFYGCSSLSGIIIPADVTSIDKNAFIGCQNLTGIVILNKNIEIPACICESCSNLTDVYFAGDEQDEENSLGTNHPSDDPFVMAAWHYNYIREYKISYSWSDDFNLCTATALCDIVVPETISESVSTQKTILPATCSQNGVTNYTAVFNNEVFSTQIISTDVLPMLEHTVVTDEAIAPTCTANGLTEGSHCSVCNAVIKSQEVIPATGHNYSVSYEWSENCDMCVATAVCKNDSNHIVTEKAVITSEVTVPATCVQKGTAIYTATFKNEIFTSQKKVTNNIPFQAHTASAIVKENEIEPTCTADGSYESVIYCSVCNAELSREIVAIPATGHTIVTDEAVPPTCITTGLTEGSHCSVCGEVIVKQETVPLADHNYSYIYTWSKDGSMCVASAVCKNSDAHTITETATITSKVFTLETCTENGTTEYTATFKNPIFEKQVKYIDDISATGHTEADEQGKCVTCGVIIDKTKYDLYIAQHATITVPNGTTVKYNYDVTMTAKSSLSGEYSIQWYDQDGNRIGTGETITTKLLTKDSTFTAKIVNSNGNVVSTSAQEKTVTIKVNNSFFTKIISFFMKLFGKNHVTL